MSQQILTIALAAVITFYTLDMAEKAWNWTRRIAKAPVGSARVRWMLIALVIMMAVFFWSCLVIHVSAPPHNPPMA